jgi:dTDP-4-dehydrorhamnose 3,5-epimerase
MHGTVDGVVVAELTTVANERGHLIEIARADDDWFVPFGQVYATATRPGIIKAWYRHEHQDDTLTVISGAALLALHDDRPGSPTAGSTQIVEVDDRVRRCVVVPRLVWHGFQAVGPDPAVLVHVNSAAFRLDAPDEERREPTDPTMPAIWR